MAEYLKGLFGGQKGPINPANDDGSYIYAEE